MGNGGSGCAQGGRLLSLRRGALRAGAVVSLLLGALGCGGGDEGPQKATIYRDTWGVPHIVSRDAEAGLYASGWAQAEDRLEQILKNYLLGMGQYAAVFGPGEDGEWFRSDVEARIWDHYGTAKRYYAEKLNPELRRHIEAFVAGINGYIDAHPEEVPAWWRDRPGAVDLRVDRFMPVAFSRQFLWDWPAGQVADDLRAVGLKPSYDVDRRASNEIALAPSRTTFGAAALIIDPHLAWFGRQRYWEVRLDAGDIHISGFATAGLPYVNLGHNRHVAWAHTTGGPDTADVYELELDAEKLRYRYDGAWRELEWRLVEVPVRGERQPRAVSVWSSHHGPIVARSADGTKAYAAAIAYKDEIGYLESKYWFMLARDYKGAMKALEVRQIMPQNVMVADTKGNIYYQRTGRVPKRPYGFDWNAPVDGTSSRTEWQGIHDAADLMSVLNPSSGYMQNNNVGPDTMMVDDPLDPKDWPSYLYNQPKRYTHQRGAVAVALLEAKKKWSEEDLEALALDTSVYQAERWVAELEAADAAHGGEVGSEAARGKRRREAETAKEEAKLAYGAALDALRGWDHRADANSRGALVYYFWRRELLAALLEPPKGDKGRGEQPDEAAEAGAERVAQLERSVDDWLAPFGANGGAKSWRAGALSEDQQRAMVVALERAATLLEQRFGLEGGHFDATFGDVFRVGRLDATDNRSWPVGGGSLREEGMATLRAIGFGPERADGTRWGRSGQTSTEVVVLTDPIRSWTQPPIGQSDRPDSPHYRDQAEKLFSPGKLKESWFGEDALSDEHIESKEELSW